MGKLAQYRLLKKVKKMLDTPVKREETYDVSSAPIYVGDKSPRSENHESNPNYSLRRTQVREIASTLLQQISRMEKLLQGNPYSTPNDDTRVVINETFTELAIAFAELDAAIIFTDAEKAERRRRQPDKIGPKSHTGRHLTSTDEETLAHLRLKIENWQIENISKQRKVNRIETTIRDLGLNVNDVRCTQILSDKMQAIRDLEATVTAGARLCRETFREVQKTTT